MKLEQKLYNKVVKELEEKIFEIEDILGGKYLNAPKVTEELEEQLRFYNEILDLLFRQHDQIKTKDVMTILFEEGIE